MAHTLREQLLNFNNITTIDDIINIIHNLFVEQFGYKKSGNYYFSPIDENFGIRFYHNDGDNNIIIAISFDGGATEVIGGKIPQYSSNNFATHVRYQVSKSEKVILLRFCYNYYSSSYRYCNYMITHDDVDKTVWFRTDYSTGSSAGDLNNIYIIDERKQAISVNYTYTNNQPDKLRVNKLLSNVIYRYPSHYNLCNLSELYGVCNLNAYDYSYLPSYIQFDNVVYRIVSMSTGTINNNFLPHFAFPVSDQAGTK